MSNFLVSTTSDSGIGSLRQAIIDANGDPGSTITFGAGIANSTIFLLSDLPKITTDMTIDGSTQHITIDGGGVSRAFFISDPSGNVSVSFLTINNVGTTGGAGTLGGGGGLGAGAAIYVAAGNVSVSHVDFANAHATGGAGGASIG